MKYMISCCSHLDFMDTIRNMGLDHNECLYVPLTDVQRRLNAIQGKSVDGPNNLIGYFEEWERIYLIGGKTDGDDR